MHEIFFFVNDCINHTDAHPCNIMQNISMPIWPLILAQCALSTWRYQLSYGWCWSKLRSDKANISNNCTGFVIFSRCFCPPSCTNTQYFASHSLATFPNKASRVMKDLKQEYKVGTYKTFIPSSFINENQDRQEDLSLLHVHFKDLAMIKYNKDVIYSIEVGC